MSVTCTISLLTRPGATCPGQRIRHGVRSEPSMPVKYEPSQKPEVPRQGNVSSGPLSPAKTTMVLSAMFSSSSRSSSVPKSASISSRQSAQSPAPLVPLNSSRGTVGKCSIE